MKSKGDVAGSGAERVLCCRRGRKCMTCHSELSCLVCFLQFCFRVNILAVWDEGLFLIVFATVFV